MQIKKELLLFCSLVLICISLIMAENNIKESPENCNLPVNAPLISCKNEIKNSVPVSPWNFITQGIFHLVA